MPTLRELALLLFILGGSNFAQAVNVPARRLQSTEPGAGPLCQVALEMDPISDLTTSRRPVPATHVIPLPTGSRLTLRVTASGDACSGIAYSWAGAREASDRNGESTADFLQRREGDFTVQVAPVLHGVEITRQLR